MRSRLIARSVGVACAVVSAALLLGITGTAKADDQPPPPPPAHGAPQAAPQTAPPSCGQGCGSTLVYYHDYWCPCYYPVPYYYDVNIYNVYRRHYYNVPCYYPVPQYHYFNVGDYPVTCPHGGGPCHSAAPAPQASEPPPPPPAH